MRNHEEVLTLVKHFIDAKKPIAAICHGLQLLTAITDSIKGVKVSGYYAC